MKTPVILLLALVIGIGVGKASEDEHAYEPPPTKTVVKTKVVEKEIVRKVYAEPEVCKTAHKAAERAVRAIDKYEEVLGRETRVQEESYHAMTSNDPRLMNKAVSDHRSVINDTVAAALQIQEARTELKSAITKCRNYPEK